MLIESTRSTSILSANQIDTEHNDAPLLPPDEIIESKDNSVDGSPRTSTFNNAVKARQAYHRLQKGKHSVNRLRKFVFGAIYNNLFPGYYVIDPIKEDVDLKLILPSNQETIIRIRLLSPHEGTHCQQLLTSIVVLGKRLSGPGNARGSKVGDVGAMHAFGIRSYATKEVFKGTLENAQQIKIISTLMRDWMEDNMSETLKNILTADKKNGTYEILSSMPKGPGSRIMYSVNLGNSGHFDTGDTSESVAIWVELKPGEAKNWYFVLPNVSFKGSAGLVVKLRHGVAIAWDGRKVYHCSSKAVPGKDNKVFGCMWGSSR